jgi:hypothetical protein
MIRVVYSALVADQGKPPTAWWWTMPHSDRDEVNLPPDVMHNHRTNRMCNTQGEHGFICTRLPCHGGRHAASDGRHIVAVWP